MKKAKFSVSYEILESLMKLPEDAHILYVISTVEHAASGVCEIYVTDPSFPEVAEGQIAPERIPSFNEHGFAGWYDG